MIKIKRISKSGILSISFKCPKCKKDHKVPVSNDNVQRKWKWNWSDDKPSISHYFKEDSCEFRLIDGEIFFR